MGRGSDISAVLAQIGGKSGKAPKGRRVTGRRKLPQDEMNGLERDYAGRLESDPAVAWYKFHPMKLRLAKRTFYEIDFLVLRTTGALEFHEVKGGHWEDDARVKVKVASEAFPVPFFIATRNGQEWALEEV